MKELNLFYEVLEQTNKENDKELIDMLEKIRENLKMLKEENEKQIEGWRKVREELEESERRRKERFGS